MDNQQHLAALKEMHEQWPADHKFHKLVGLIIDLLAIVTTDLQVYRTEQGFVVNGEAAVVAIYNEIDAEASGLFINSKGQASGYSQLKLDTDGLLRIGPGETDSFGWLSGIIYAQDTKMVYG